MDLYSRVQNILFSGYTYVAEGFDESFICDKCQRVYKYDRSLKAHQKFECGKEPQFVCPAPGCGHRSKTKGNLKQHVGNIHSDLFFENAL